METTDLLTLDKIARNPALVTHRFILLKATGSEEIIFRPLLHNDDLMLAEFFESLSAETRLFATYPSYDLKCAQEFCYAINQYDKLRMVAISEDGKIIALFEFSLDLVDSDIERFHKYSIKLDAKSDVRFGPCIIDKYQNQHLGTKLLQLMIDLAIRMGKKRMILWGGVLINNQRGIRFYEKNHFRILPDKFIASDGYECYDGILQFS
ncbi:unnamed protein product [Didymodactylos carnosus]|uniref:N-acetyltransferase domain-containing protein n=1 Tax=Didymodactylos carnosus TaxID=1234261 RepID=A0A814SYC4_9BILA|nr:unnamed protein product [Didymodactylos carnosus]CAF3916988.1 unnamed protein product [Didymodactylos carnosus]